MCVLTLARNVRAQGQPHYPTKCAFPHCIIPRPSDEMCVHTNAGKVRCGTYGGFGTAARQGMHHKCRIYVRDLCPILDRISIDVRGTPVDDCGFPMDVGGFAAALAGDPVAVR